MRFPEYFQNSDKPVISFELFPPKTDVGMRTIRKRLLPNLAKHNPDYITVTYGAMGSTQSKTLEIASMIKDEFGFETACHLTCVGSSQTDINDIISKIRDAGINNIVALRGDPPQGSDTFVAPQDGFAHANELIAHIRATEPQDAPFGVAVAGYPEKHIEASDLDTDIQNLKRKVDAGGDIIVTQLFYDNQAYFDFVDKVRAAGIQAPVVAGLMPILSAKQIQRITSMCGSTIPSDLEKKLNAAIDDDDKATTIGIDQCIAQANELLDKGAPGIHFYVLNKHIHMEEIMNALPL
ncbi:MAG: methylenetetrahydrofolate reductase [NAD(P)H] [Candidatus Latescibacteria bacterium]|jgi:methylenetetrahydrofolate reductase (NADPH)|nr:methylenetetrahydrofolate reductase [NAD(P)H] [Candidatus Latescibacterota bacterium]